ncbi:MAG: type II secretion system protein [Planctomycetota bacterium]
MKWNWFPDMYGLAAGQRRSWRHGRARRSKRGRVVRRAMTLMEVILSIAILGGSLAVLGELVRVGTRSCRRAETLTSAQLLADSLATEMCADGTMTPESTEGVVERFGGASWTYAVDVQPANQEDLLVITVTVTEDVASSAEPISYSLTRWLIDPGVEMELEAAAAEMAADMETNNSSTGSGSGFSTGGNTAPGGER